MQRICRICGGLVVAVRDGKAQTMTCQGCGHREIKYFVSKGG